MSTIIAKPVESKPVVSSKTASDSVKPVKIFLIGMMGSGKSYWAEKLKKKFHAAAYDLDALVEMMEEKTIAEIFAEESEEYFRKAESKMLKLFAEKKQFIVSCGGGTACYDDNMKWMNKQGITIWIDEPIETLASRLMKEKSHRPLIKDLDDKGLAEFLDKKLAERAEFYQKAAYRLCGEELSEAAFVKILKEHA